MKSWHFAVAAMVCLAAPGCRNDPRIATLERQNRLLEDEIYRLRWALEDASGSTCSSGPTLAAPRQNGSADRPTAAPTNPAASPSSAPDSVPSGPLQIDLGQPLGEGEQPKIFESTPPPESSAPQAAPPSSEAPRFQPGDPPDAPRFQPGSPPSAPPMQPGPSGDSRFRPTSAGSQSNDSSVRDSGAVTNLTLSRAVFGGYDADQRPGDEGIQIVLEPRDAAGRIVVAPADVTVVVIDPAIQGERGRVARWDFTTDQIARVNDGSGIPLEALWPGALPQHSGLHLFARYTTRDGRKIETNRPLQIALPGQPVQRWERGQPRPPATQPTGKVPTPPAPPRPSPSRLGAEQPISSQPRANAPTPARRPTSAMNRPSWSPNRTR